MIKDTQEHGGKLMKFGNLRFLQIVQSCFVQFFGKMGRLGFISYVSCVTEIILHWGPLDLFLAQFSCRPRWNL